MRRSIWLVPGVMLCVLLFTPNCRAADPRIEAILKDWHERRQGIETVQYVARGKQLCPKESISNDPELPPGMVMPSEDLWGKTAAVWAMDFQQGRFRFVDERDALFDEKALGYQPRSRHCLYDGRVLMIYYPGERNGRREDVFKIEPPDELAHSISDDERIVLLAHGVFPLDATEPPRAKITAASLLQSVPDIERLFVVSSDKIDDRPVIALRYNISHAPDRHWIISVDPERQSAVLRLSWHWDGRKLREVQADVDRFEGHWLPKRLRSHEYTTSGPVVLDRSSELDVVARKLNAELKRSDFQPPKMDE